MLRLALESILSAMRPLDELIVVDSASRDAAVIREVVADRAPLLRVDRPGLSRARNVGWRAATKPIVAFTDDDCEVSSRWFETIEDVFGDPAVGFMTGRVVGDRESAIGVSTFIEQTPRRFDGPQDPASFGSGANMAFRRRVLEEIGGFDEELGSGTALRSAEDHDAFWRALRAGWAGVYHPAAVVTHRLWRGRMRSIGREFGYGVGAGALALKVVRGGDPRGWQLLRARLWSGGVARSVRELVRGHETASAALMVKAAGAAVGAVRSRRLALEGEMLRPKRRGRSRTDPGG